MLFVFVLSLLGLVVTFALGWVSRRLWKLREWAAFAIVASLALATFGANPLAQMLADELIARPYANRMKTAADSATLLGKDLATVTAALGQPASQRTQTPTVLETATLKVTQQRATYSALEYYPTRAIYLGTRFLVFLDAKGTVTGYRVKWERAPSDRVDKDLVAERLGGP